MSWRSQGVRATGGLIGEFGCSIRRLWMGTVKGSFTKFSPEVRREVMRLGAQALSMREIAGRLGLSKSGVHVVLRPFGGVIRRDVFESTGRRLCAEERVEIYAGVQAGWSYRQI